VSLLLIDGRSGSGKTELAAAISATWPEAQVVHMDDLYPGWGGLAAGSEYLLEVLRTGRYERWSWTTNERAEEYDVGRPLIVEGAGSITAATRALADYAIWVELDAETRKRRALARDPYFVEPWDAWAAQENAHADREHPARLADAVVFGHDVTIDAARWRAHFAD
jgi:cytidylate kinase